MTADERDILKLIGRLEDTRSELSRFENEYSTFHADFADFSPNLIKYRSALLADLIVDYYTCLETAFVRVSKFFENSLDDTKWHKNLLDNMRIRIPNLREALLSDESYALLDELRRFRHFKRYYFERRYNRERMEFLETQLRASIPLIHSDFNRFLSFLHSLHSALIS